MCDRRSGKSMTSAVASILMNGVCCSWQVHPEDDKRTSDDDLDAGGTPVFRYRPHASGKQLRQFTFHDDDWDLEQPTSMLQDERRRSVMRAKLGAMADVRIHHHSQSSYEERDITTGYDQYISSSGGLPFMVGHGRPADHHLHRHGKGSGSTQASSWYGRHPVMPTTPMSDGSLADLDDDDEDSELELVEKSSFVDVPF